LELEFLSIVDDEKPKISQHFNTREEEIRIFFSPLYIERSHTHTQTPIEKETKAKPQLTN